MPIDKSKYPDDWDEIASEYKESVGWKCEKCGASHKDDGTMGSCLTVHHPDHDPGNEHAVLVALCARCHLKEERFHKFDKKHENQLTLEEYDE